MVVRFEPTNGAAFAQMARIIDSTGRALMPQDLAALDWASRKAIRLSPADATAWWGRAAYLKRSGDKAEALEAMERALKIGMEEAYFHLDHASLLVDTGNMAEACEAFQRARSYIWNFPEWLECFEREQAVEGWALRFAQEHPSPEAGRIRRFSLGIPERPQDTPVHQIDLSDFYNTALNDLWRMKDLDYGGRTDLLVNGVARCPVQFDLRGLIQIANPGPTAEIKNMPVGQSCRFLWFLHGARNEEVEGTEIARYVLHTADGVEHVVPVVYGKDVLIWATPEKGASRSLESIWEFSAKHGYHQRLFVTQWRNPDPTVRVETVDFICHDTKAVPFLIAITAEP